MRSVDVSRRGQNFVIVQKSNLNEHQTTQNAEEVTVVRSLQDIRVLLKHLNQSFPTMMMPIFPLRPAASWATRFPSGLCEEVWITNLLCHLGCISEVAKSETMQGFFSQSPEFVLPSVAPSARSSGFDAGMESKLLNLLIGEKKAATHPSPRDCYVGALRRFIDSANAMIVELTAMAAKLDKDVSARQRRVEANPPRSLADVLMSISKNRSPALFAVGERVLSSSGEQGTVLHVLWEGKDQIAGVRWDNPKAGECDGTRNNMKHFHCGRQQGSFVKSASLFRDGAEDDTLCGLAGMIVEVEKTLVCAPKDLADDAGRVLLAVEFLLCQLHAAVTWAQKLVTQHNSLQAGEGWLIQQKLKKAPVVDKEMAVEDVTALLAAHWNQRHEMFTTIWRECRAAREELAKDLTAAFARYSMNLDRPSTQALSALSEGLSALCVREQMENMLLSTHLL